MSVNTNHSTENITASSGTVTVSNDLKVTASSSGVNYAQVTGNGATGPVKISAAGTDTDISLNLSSKGGYNVGFYTNNFANLQFNVAHTPNAVNYMQAAGAATGGQPYFAASGSDTNIGVAFYSKGTGNISFSTAGGSNLILNVSDTAVTVNSSLAITKGYTETVYTLSGTDINPVNGTIQTKTLAGNTTFTESLADGQSVVLMLNPATYTTGWPTISWVNSAGSGAAPTLKASAMNVVVLWQVGGVLYGNWIGSM